MKKQQHSCPPKTYRGFRRGGDTAVEVTTHHSDGTERTAALDPRLNLWNHSPTGFEWGYSGSGPAQLALALLADHFDVPRENRSDAAAERAVALHQQFKFAVVSGLDPLSWSLTTEEIAASVRAITVRNRLTPVHPPTPSAEISTRP